MEKFENIKDRALARKGGESGLKSCLPTVKSPRTIAALGNDRVLAEMTRCVFQAGFVWRVVNAKWDDFERVFFAFKPEALVRLSPEQIEAIAKNPAIIRNMQKIKSVQLNAQFILDMSREHDSFGKFLKSWPKEDLVGLHRLLKRQGSRLGGATGPRSLRNLGVDTFLLSGDVVKCLQQAGLEIADNPTSQRDLAQVQAAFNTWHQESGLSYSHMSRICSCSIGENYLPEQLQY